MRTFLTAAAALAVLTSTAAATAAPSARAGGCGSGIGPTKYSATKTIKGKSVVVNCGPAIAKLHFKGTTYTFKHGTCFRYLGSFKLNLGSSLLVPTAGSGGYSSMTITASSNTRAEIGAAVGKLSIYAAAKFSGAATKGSFTSITTGVPFTGSWTCGGPIEKD